MRPQAVVFALLIMLLSASPARAVAPGVAGVMSIIPGLGQVANGNYLEGGAWFTTVLGLFFMKNPNVSNIGYKLWQYNMYDAYRDAGAHDTAKDGVVSNYVAAFNPMNIVDPISVGTLSYAGLRSIGHGDSERLGPRNILLGAGFYGFVGLGEEGLFRGFLFPGFSHLTGSYWAGAAISSALFSLSHLTNSQAYYHSALGLGELFLFGMVMSWQTYRNKFDLRHSIFTHAWYDVIIEYANERVPESPRSILPDKYGIRLGFSF